MEDKIRKHVEELFAGTLPTKKAVELKEEMIQNLTEKYNDLIGEGKTPEAAFNIVVAGIGDVSGLIRDLEEDPAQAGTMEKHRQRSAMLTAISIMLYIVSVVPLIMISMSHHTQYGTSVGVAVMLVFVAAATGLLIYNGMTKPKYVKTEDSMVEEFREWQSDRQELKTLRGSVNAALWSLIVAAYFIISFLTGAWYITWVIFLIGAALNAIINIGFALRKR
jgi:hypothetical protein